MYALDLNDVEQHNVLRVGDLIETNLNRNNVDAGGNSFVGFITNVAGNGTYHCTLMQRNSADNELSFEKSLVIGFVINLTPSPVSAEGKPVPFLNLLLPAGTQFDPEHIKSVLSLRSMINSIELSVTEAE